MDDLALGLISKIKEAKKYKNISEEVIRAEVERFLKNNPRWQEYKEKFVLKQIKAKLHKMHGSFQVSNK